MEKINGEVITGIAVALLAIIFIYAGRVNDVWRIILPADFIILVLGAAFIALGMWTIYGRNRKRVKENTSS